VFFSSIDRSLEKIRETIEIPSVFEFSGDWKSGENGEKPKYDMGNPHVSIAVGFLNSGVNKKLVFMEEKRQSDRFDPINRLSTRKPHGCREIPPVRVFVEKKDHGRRLLPFHPD